jgi:hypothetical protein
MRVHCLLPLLALGACATVPPEPAAAEPAVTIPAAPAGTCRRDRLASFAGQPRSDALAKSILAASGAKTIRWVAYGMMVTMDYRDDRVTVWLNAANRIDRVSCG